MANDKINFNDSLPAAPVGKLNIKWQVDHAAKAVSAYVDVGATTIVNVVGLQAALDLKASIAYVDTQDAATLVLSKAYTDSAVVSLVNAAPGALDTLKELADALGDDANFASTVTASLALKASIAYVDAADALKASIAYVDAADTLLAPKASPALSGTPTTPTASALTNNTQISSTAYADAAVAVEAAARSSAVAGAVLLAPSADQTILGAFALQLTNAGASFKVTNAALVHIESNVNNYTEIQGSLGGINTFFYDAGGGNASGHIFRRGRGTAASATALGSSDAIGYLNWKGYDGSTYFTSAQIQGLAQAAFDTTHHGTTMVFNAVLAAGNGLTEIARFNNSAGVNFSALPFAVVTTASLGFAAANGALDAAMSRLGAASLAIGNGTASDISGTLTLTTLISGNGALGTPSISPRSGTAIGIASSSSTVLDLNTVALGTIDLNDGSTNRMQILLQAAFVSFRSQVANTGIGLVSNQTTRGDAAAIILTNNDVNMTGTSGAQWFVHSYTPFAPSSGTATFAALMIQPTINQTGGANGTIRCIAAYPVNTALVGTEYLLALGTSSASGIGATLTDKFTVSSTGAITIGGLDAGISRLGAASLAIGNGTAADFTGALKLGALSQVNATASTSGVMQQNSPIYTLSGTYWDGTQTNVDSWTIQGQPTGAGAPSSTISRLVISHTGASSAFCGVCITGVNLAIGSTTTNFAGAGRELSLSAGTSGDATFGLVLQGSRTAGSSIIGIIHAYNQGNVSARITFTNDSATDGASMGFSTKASGGTLTQYFTIGTTGNLTSINPTAATSGAGKSSPIFTTQGNYWDGAATQTDNWTLQNIIDNNVSGNAKLTLTHTGTLGNATSGIPLFAIGAIVQINPAASAVSGNFTENGLSITHSNGTNLTLVVGNGGKLASGQVGIYQGVTRMASFTTFGVILNSDTWLASAATVTSRIVGGQGAANVGVSIKLQNNCGNAGAFNATSGTQTDVEIGTASNSSWTPSSGNATWNLLRIAQVINTSGTYAGIVRGIYYNPTTTSLTGVTHKAFESTAGDVKFGGGAGLLLVTTNGSDTKVLEIGDTTGYGTGSGGIRLAPGASSGYAEIAISNANGNRFQVTNAAGSTILGLLQTDSNGFQFAASTFSSTVSTPVNLTQYGQSGGKLVQGVNTELLTLSTAGTTTDSVANLLPANSIIDAVTVRVTTAITTATDWSVGDATTAARFASANATMTLGAASIGVNQIKGSVSTDAAGPVQIAAAKVRITTTGTPGAGAVRITVYYRQFVGAGA